MQTNRYSSALAAPENALVANKCVGVVCWCGLSRSLCSSFKLES